jgi:hypothetical protein
MTRAPNLQRRAPEPTSWLLSAFQDLLNVGRRDAAADVLLRLKEELRIFSVTLITTIRLTAGQSDGNLRFIRKREQLSLWRSARKFRKSSFHPPSKFGRTLSPRVLQRRL